MKCFALVALGASILAGASYGQWEYGGAWGSYGSGDGGSCRFKDLLFGFDDGKLTATKHNYKPARRDNVTIGE